ncbi:MAG TPA: recombinase RecA [Verrucomicrobiae bacterium]|nr:recombinase RecA [Verrucomicrobiae bacterium]
MPPKTDPKDKDAAAAKAGALKDKNLQAALAAIEKQYGSGSIMRLGDETARTDIPVISTGAFALDLALGVGGIPRGRITEVFGPESSGKTTLMLSVIANAQRGGGLAAFVDAEHAVDPAYAKRIGVNLDDLLISQPDSGEEALTIAETLIRSNAVDVVVVDSVAALVPRSELEGQMGDATVGAQARLMSQAMRKLTSVIHKAKTACIFTNQIREKIGVMFGNPETTPGGRALKFYSSVRIDMRRINVIKDSAGKVVGSHVRAKVVKNKVAPPFTESEFDIMYDVGIAREGSVIDVATDLEVIEKKGSWLAFDGQQIGQGRESAKDFLRENGQMLDAIVAAVRAKIAAGAHVPKKIGAAE